MSIKFFSALALAILLQSSIQVQAQSQAQCAAAIESKATEIVGQIKVKNKDNRFVVDDASFTMDGNLATIFFKSGKDEVYYNFSPADITEIQDGNLDPGSPVGVMVLKLKDYIGQQINDPKKGDREVSFVNKVYFNYLKKDPKNYPQLEKLLKRLKELTAASESENPVVELLEDETSFGDFWTSAKNESYTYTLLDAYYSGNSIKYFYKLERVTLSATKTDKYMVEIPLANIETLILNKKNTRPASYWVESGKNAFDVYQYDSDDKQYKLYNAQTRMPLFMEAMNGSGHIELVKGFEDAVRKAGGKVKVKTND